MSKKIQKLIYINTNFWESLDYPKVFFYTKNPTLINAGFKKVLHYEKHVDLFNFIIGGY